MSLISTTPKTDKKNKTPPQKTGEVMNRKSILQNMKSK